MKSILRKLPELEEADLYALSEAVELELHRREEALVDEDVDSARHRAVERGRTYRQRNGAAAPPVRTVGIGRVPLRRFAA